MPADSDDRSPLAHAILWVTRVLTASLSLALPPLGGYWLDRFWGTPPVFLVAGLLFGFMAGGWQLYRIVKALEREVERDGKV